MIEGLGTRLHNFNVRVPERGSLGTRLGSGHEKTRWTRTYGGGALNSQELPGVWSDSNHNNVQLAVFARSATVCTALQTR